MIASHGALYLDDAYLKECTAKVVSVKDGRFIVLDKTIFYPRGGGQPSDTGTITREKETFNVVFVGTFDGNISHEVDKEGLEEGDIVTAKIDWERRHKLMRMHTAAHILSARIHKDTGTLITGNNLDTEKSHIDFDLETTNQELLHNTVKEANNIVTQNIPVTYTFMKREEALKDETLFRLAKGAPDVPIIRIVTIGNIDRQADGGTHVKTTKEIGTIKFLKCENKGKGRKRLYYTLEQ